MLLSVSLKCQVTVDTTYYKDYYLSKKTSKKKAYFMHVKSMKGSKLTEQTLRKTDGRVYDQKMFDNDLPCDIWKNRDSAGKLIYEYDFNKLVYCDSTDSDVIKEKHNDLDSSFTEAKFDSIFVFLSKNLKYPLYAKENGIMGTVFLSFHIDVKGGIKDVCILKGAHPILDIEAFRVVNLMPKWTPATKDGNAVETIYSLPMRFSLK